MAGKPRQIIIEPSEFRIYLASRMMVQKQSVAELAESLGISGAAAYQLLAGDLGPNEDVLRQVGLRIAYVADELPGGEGPKGKPRK